MMIGQSTRTNWKASPGIWALGGVVASAALLLGGCSWVEPAPYEADPLLQNRHPSHASHHHGGDFARLPLQEPLVPTPPPMPVHAGPPAQHILGGIPLPSSLPNEPPEESEELPAPKKTSDESSMDGVPPMPQVEVTESISFKETEPTTGGPELTAPRQVPGNFGKGPEYAWLQGVVDRHYRGHVSLRYQRPSEDDTWGGKVNLLGEGFLEGFESGDVIYVEGELRPEEAPDQMNGKLDYPGYRIRGAWLVKRRP